MRSAQIWKEYEVEANKFPVEHWRQITDGTYLFVISGENFLIDYSQYPIRVQTGPVRGKPGITLTMADETFVQLSEGRLNGMNAFTRGKLKMKGELTMVAKLKALFKVGRNSIPVAKSAKSAKSAKFAKSAKSAKSRKRRSVPDDDDDDIQQISRRKRRSARHDDEYYREMNERQRKYYAELANRGWGQRARGRGEQRERQQRGREQRGRGREQRQQKRKSQYSYAKLTTYGA